MKRAFVVVGPESSGNRMLAAILVRAGCAGAGQMDQPFEIAEEQDPAVMIRSYPHGNEWPDLPGLYEVLRGRGYMVTVLVTVRDPWCVQRSQTERQHHPEALALANVRRAYLEIFRQLALLNVWWLLVPYEALVLHPRAAVVRLLDMLGLPSDTVDDPLVVEGASVPITNANARHYA